MHPVLSNLQSLIVKHPRITKTLLALTGAYLSLKSFRFLVDKWNRKDLNGKNVLITGGAGASPKSLGRLMAYEFASQGANVIILDLDQKHIDQVVNQIQQAHPNVKVYGFVCDITNHERVFEMEREISQTIGHVDVLVNNAGIVGGDRILQAKPSRMNVTMQVNTISHFWTTKAFLPNMLERGSGHVVTIASAAGLAGSPGLVDYTASKFGAVGFHESLLAELTSQNIYSVDLTLVCPYFIDTGMFDGVQGTFFCPVLNAQRVAQQIVYATQHRHELLLIPSWLWASWIMRLTMPPRFMYWFGYWVGLLKGMDTFVGHANPNEAQKRMLK